MDTIGILVLALIGLLVLIRAFIMMFSKEKNKASSPPLSQNTIRRDASKSIQGMSEDIGEKNLQDLCVSFEDIAGIDEVKEDLLEIIDYLRNPQKYKNLDIYLPKGILLVGPPGVGKTMIAKALASEANVPFFYQSGSSFAQIFVGFGAKRVNELFAKARAKTPSIIFIDEIDSVGKARGGNRNDERESTLNQLLTEMDGFEDMSQVIVIAATNKIESIDEALLRSGRFDRKIYIDLPNLHEREKILELYLKNKNYSFDIGEIAKLCVGFSGAALATLINESALRAMRVKQTSITKEMILEIKDKVVLGKKRVETLSQKEKQILCVYKSAKALCAYWFSIEFENIALTSESFQEREKTIINKSELLSQVKFFLAGSVATELFFDESFNIAREDLLRAKAIAKEICEYGMGSRICTDINEEIEILEHCKADIKAILSNNKALLEKIINEFFVSEILTKEMIKKFANEVLA